MSTLLLIMAGWFALGTLLLIGMIGKPRKPVTPGMAVFCTLVVAVEIVILVKAALEGVTP